MIKKFAQFWIDNAKVTIVLILVTVFAGVGAYIMIPKQYNPDIPVPAFNIIVPAPGYSTKEVEHLVVEPLEDKIAEIQDMDHIYGVSNKDFWVVTAQFKVGTDKEKATTRLYNKIFENLGKKPLWVKDPLIYKMDPDDFPIYTFAIVKEEVWWNNPMKSDEKNNKKDFIWLHQKTSSDLIQLRKIAIDVSNKLKFIKGTSVFYLVGGYPANVNVLLDLNKLEWKNIDIMQVYQAIKNNNLVFPGWQLKLDKTQASITIDGNMADIDKLKKLVIGNYNWKPVYLWEVAKIFVGIPEFNYYTYVTGIWTGLKAIKEYPAVYVGVAKEKWVNAVVLTKKIKQELEKIQQTLPEGVKFVEVADEWKVAAESTNSLLINLAESVVIVFLVLLFYLGKRDAINNAFAIPLTLFMVFLIAYILWDNINRIVLFALVLALWMLVDNSTVVIENIARHIKERKEWETIKEAILKAVDEVWVWVVLATITRILALVAMFFVTGMMGEYMGWVPKYVIISLLVSLLIAFSINPFIAYFFYKGEVGRNSEEVGRNNEKTEKPKIYKTYERFMKKFLGIRNTKRRKLFKLVFWISLFAVIIVPPSLWIFKMAMLPKDNKNQVYIWIDGPRSWSVKQTQQAATYADEILNNFNVNNCHPEKLGLTGQNYKEYCIIKNVIYAVGTAPVTDFSNAFRGVDFRKMPYQITTRVNLIDKNERDLSSIDFAIEFRKIFEKLFREKYPEAKVRLLEDPAGPPVRASFMLKIQGERDVDYKDLESLAERLKQKLMPIFKKDDVVDVYTTVDTYKTNYKIEIDHQLLSSYGLDVQQVAYTIYNIFKWMDVSLIHDTHTREPINIYLSVDPEQKYVTDIFNKISFMNKQGVKIYLKQFAKIVPTSEEHTIYTEDRYQAAYIYGEVGNNSVWYPATHTTWALIHDSFWDGKFKVVSWNPYEVTIKSTQDGQTYKIGWWGERKISLDTFRDLGIAMMMALLAIYFLMVAQFKSFKIAGVIMMTFLLGLFGIMPGFSLLYVLKNEFFTAPSMIWVIALAWIVVGNAIILIEYLNLLLKKWYNKTLALIKAGETRMRAIIITSLTTVLGSLTILWDPVWWGLGRSIVWWLSVSAVLTLIVIPIFLYDVIECEDEHGYCGIDELVELEKEE